MTRFLRLVAASLVLLMISLLHLGAAQADALDEAKAQGLVGEQADGYVGAVGDAGSVQALIDEINAKRRAKYAEIAAKRDAPTEAVAAIAGKKLIERTPAGQYVRTDNGGWVEK